MKAFFIALIVIFVGVRLLTLVPQVKPLQPQKQPPERLLPRFLAPRTFADVQSGAKNMYRDECITEAMQANSEAWRKSIDSRVRPDGSTGRRAQVTAFLVCEIEGARLIPERLCLGDARVQLTRHMRGYFALLRRLKDAPPPPQAFVELQRRMDTGSDIVSGADDFSPDPRIIDGFASLIRDGVYTKADDLAGTLSPEVPRPIIAQFTAVQPGEAICHE